MWPLKTDKRTSPFCIAEAKHRNNVFSLLECKHTIKILITQLTYDCYPTRDGSVYDVHGKPCKLYPQTIQILLKLYSTIKLAIASRIEDIAGAYQLIHFLSISRYFTFKEIYPGCKTMHFLQLKKRSGIEFQNMLFFDDDRRNIRDVNKLGVATFQVYNGITEDQVVSALTQFDQNYCTKV